MFGYVRPYRAELRVREDEYYKGTYCGLCKAMGRCTGQCSRLTLNYDFVTFALIRFALSEEKTSFLQKRCLFHPLKKRSMMQANDQLDYTACVSSLLSYHKIKDDISDEGFAKRSLAKIFLLPAASHMKKKAFKAIQKDSEGLRALDSVCAQKLSALSDIELNYSPKHACTPSVDIPAGIFGELMGELMSFGFEPDSPQKKIAFNAGFHLGKWIYVADALDDAKKDKESGSFNPILNLYGGEIPTSEQMTDMELALTNELYGLEAALDLIDYTNSDNFTAKEIINNVIYLGMPKKIESICEKYR